jgi:hypothetical protein
MLKRRGFIDEFRRTMARFGNGHGSVSKFTVKKGDVIINHHDLDGISILLKV